MNYWESARERLHFRWCVRAVIRKGKRVSTMLSKRRKRGKEGEREKRGRKKREKKRRKDYFPSPLNHFYVNDSTHSWRYNLKTACVTILNTLWYFALLQLLGSTKTIKHRRFWELCSQEILLKFTRVYLRDGTRE